MVDVGEMREPMALPIRLGAEAATGERLRCAEPCVLVIIGASGDLAHRKLVPALAHLRYDGLLDRYRKSYPTPEAMGHLDFSGLEIRQLGPDAALVLGNWHLKRSIGDAGGVFTLVFQRFPQGWRIVQASWPLTARKTGCGDRPIMPSFTRRATKFWA